MILPPKIEDLKKLLQKKYRDEYGFFIAEGEHLVLELIEAVRSNPSLSASRIYVSQDHIDDGMLRKLGKTLPVHWLSAKQIASLSDTRTPQGIVAVVPILPPQPARSGERIIYLHEIQDPGNLGTILRTLAWFGGFRCLLSPQSVDPYNPKVVRASMGAIFRIPIETDVSFDQLQGRYPRLALLDKQGAPLSNPAFRNFDGYVFGNEARGLPAELVARLQTSSFSIPGGGQVESLNLATAVNICVYELKRV